MKYLQRAARRLAPVGASDGTTRVRPAMPSHSPLAEADQRLNLDSFAERFDAPLVPERTAPMIEEEEAATTLSLERPPENGHEAARPSYSHTRPARRTQRLEAHSEPTKAERAGRPSREISPHAPMRPDTHAAPLAQRSAHGDPETLAAPVKPSDLPARRANASVAPAADEVRAHTPDPAHTASSKVPGGAGPLAREQAAQPMLDALSRAMSWVEGQPHPGSPVRGRVEERGTPSALAHPPSGETSPMRPVRAAARERAPVTHLAIGKIEVEIVPPPKPAPPAAPHSPAPRTNGHGSALRTPFGWRQR